MTDHPSTYKAAETTSTGIDWDDHATLHARDDGQGLFDGLKALHRGTFAEMVRLLANMPPAKRAGFVIQKAGDRQVTAEEAVTLAQHPDFPPAG